MEKKRKHTLINVRRIMTAQKTGVAGVMPETSFMIFMALMATFSRRRARFCSLESVSIVKTCGGWEKMVWCAVEFGG